MKGDFSRRTFDPAKHYSATLLQQGRVLTDADWTEERDIVAHRNTTTTGDIVGMCGAPMHAAGFHTVTGVAGLTPEEQQYPGNQAPVGDLQVGDFLISAGRFYVDGLLVENEEIVPYSDQPDLHDPPLLDDDGLYLLYLDVWERHLTALDDPSIREVALGGPDTSTRSKTVWQVKAWPIPEDQTPEDTGNCLVDLPGFTNLTAPSEGQMSARASVEEISEDPCIVPPGAGYRGLENQLYRVEIHDPGSAYDVAGGAGVVTVTATPAPNQVTVDGGAWEIGQPVEVFLSGNPLAGTLAHIVDTGDGLDLTLNTNLRAFTPDEQPQLRLRPVEATFVWSRDNGSVVTEITEIDDLEVTVADLGPDSVLGFAVGQWVEIIDDRLELNGQPGQLTQIAGVDPDSRTVMLTSPAAPLDPAGEGGVNTDLHPKLRRWDGASAVRFDSANADESWIELENGVQVQFSLPEDADQDVTDYRTGDYWLIPARTATADALSGNIEWPVEGDEPVPLSPRGIHHHYCRLALAQMADGTLDILTDCRPIFPPVTELTTMYYVSGDGQEAMPGNRIPQPLEVGVFNGRVPVAEARVIFTADGAGRLVAGDADPPGGADNTEQVMTDAEGIARVSWTLDPANPATVSSQQVVARLLDSNNDPLGPVVRFNGNHSIAAQVAYQPGACEALAEASTVQEALDILCRREGGGGCHCTLVGEGGEFATLNEAIAAALERGDGEICICLLHGDHDVPGLGVSIEDPDREVHLTITGCGPGTRITLRDNMFLERLASFRLRDVDILARQQANIEINLCREVEVTGCGLAGVIREQSLFIVRGAGRLLIGDNVIEVLAVDLDLPRRFFDGVRGLEELYQINDLWEFRRFARRIALELAQLNRDERAAIAEQLRARLDQLQRSMSRGQFETILLLIQALEAPEAEFLQLASDLEDIRRATIDVDPGPAIEIATLPEDLEFVAPVRGSYFGSVILENNHITGIVSIYGPPDREGTIISPTEGFGEPLRPLISRGVARLLGAFGSLHIRNNRMSRLAVSQATIVALIRLVENDGGELRMLFNDCLCTDNVIEGQRNQIVVRRLSLTSNHFTGSTIRPGEQPQVAASAVADGAVYTGNHGWPIVRDEQPIGVPLFNTSRASEQAANLELRII